MALVKVIGDPTKDFFVHMITKDIALEDCIFDLIDNSIDGARKAIERKGTQGNKKAFQGFKVAITANKSEFKIEDNGSGISVEEAKKSAFRFGRKSSDKPDAVHGIGLYGIGMKRAMFKMGNHTVVESSTTDESFSAVIDVPEWLQEEDTWDFGLEVGKKKSPGTKITITELNAQVAQELSDQVFINRLKTTIARDYSLILQQGLLISVNKDDVDPFVFRLLESKDFKPARKDYEDDGIKVRVYAGYANVPKDDDEEERRTRLSDEYYGWFVVCNDRVVLAADKTEKTIWNDEGFQEWHPQYNGFMGVVFFDSDDPRKLPWTTTKRGIDVSSPIYRRAVSTMKEAATEFIKYTNARKANLEEAKQREQDAKSVPVQQVTPSQLVVPKFADSTPRTRVANITYQRPMAMVEKAKAALGKPYMTNKDLGIATFNYFVRQEIGK